MLPLAQCSLMRGILLIAICGSNSLMSQGQKAIKGHCLLDYTALMAAQLAAKAGAPELWLTAETQIWTFHLSWPLYSDQSASTCLRWALRGTAAFLSTKYTFSRSAPCIRLRTSAALSVANPITLEGHKTVSFPIPMQSIGTLIFMYSIHASEVTPAPCSSVNDLFTIKY